MKLKDLLVPAEYASLFGQLMEAKSVDNEGGSGRMYLVSEEWAVSLFRALGAVHTGEFASKMNKDEENESSDDLSLESIKNQLFIYGLPKELIEEIVGGDTNVLRSFMDYQSRSLTEVANQYGGKSAAANLSNLLAKSNQELAGVRSATIKKFADAVGMPEDWIRVAIQVMHQPD